MLMLHEKDGESDSFLDMRGWLGDGCLLWLMHHEEVFLGFVFVWVCGAEMEGEGGVVLGGGERCM